MAFDICRYYHKEDRLEIDGRITKSFVRIRIGKVLDTQTSSNNLDVILIGLGMTVGFCIILMHLTGMWPCQLLNVTGNIIQVDKYQNSNEAIYQFTYEMHYWLKGLFRCS
jgi:hypothetical protein